jgi:hypothetical protein
MITKFSRGDLIRFDREILYYFTNIVAPIDDTIYLTLDVLSYLSLSHPERKPVGRTMLNRHDSHPHPDPDIAR